MGKTLKILFAAIVAADFLSLYYHLFQKFFWLDIALHLAGGVWVAIFFVLVFKDKNPILMISFVALIGVLWELSEYTFLNDLMASIFGLQESVMSLDDTLADLAMDLVGASATALGYWIFKK